MREFNPDRIKLIREMKGLTQEAFGDAIGVPKQLVSAWEAKKHRPTMKTITKIINVFEVEPNYFFTEVVHQSDQQSAVSQQP